MAKTPKPDPPPDPATTTELVAIGLRPGDRVRFRRREGGSWEEGKVRSYEIWARKGPDGTLRIAIRQELFEQINKDLASMPSGKFAFSSSIVWWTSSDTAIALLPGSWKIGMA